MKIRLVLAVLVTCFSLYAVPQAKAELSVPIFSAKVLSRLLLLDLGRAGPRIVAVGARGYIIFSDDQGKSWRQATTPTQVTLTAVYFIDGTKGWAVGHDATILTTSDGGLSWRQQYADIKLGAPLLDVWFRDANFGLAVGAYGAFLETRDGGASWQSRQIKDDDKHLNAIAAGADRIYLAGESGLLLVSDDSGATWRAVASPYTGSFFGLLTLPDQVVIAYGLRGNIVRTRDGGTTWQTVHNSTAVSLMGGGVNAAGVVFLAGLGGNVLISQDSGLSFLPLSNIGGKSWAALLPIAPDELVLVGEASVKRVTLKYAESHSLP